MAMLSFRVDDSDANDIQAWAERLGLRRSDLLREALRRHLVRLGSEVDADVWDREPLTAEESSLTQIADWGPAEEWADWADATR